MAQGERVTSTPGFFYFVLHGGQPSRSPRLPPRCHPRVPAGHKPKSAKLCTSHSRYFLKRLSIPKLSSFSGIRPQRTLNPWYELLTQLNLLLQITKVDRIRATRVLMAGRDNLRTARHCAKRDWCGLGVGLWQNCFEAISRALVHRKAGSRDC